jgi:uncharacterized protein YuzB (UPF0349 family)
MYWIDPDGQGVGEDPIVAFCNMTTGTKQKYSTLKKVYSQRILRFDCYFARQRIQDIRFALQ